MYRYQAVTVHALACFCELLQECSSSVVQESVKSSSKAHPGLGPSGCRREIQGSQEFCDCDTSVVAMANKRDTETNKKKPEGDMINFGREERIKGLKAMMIMGNSAGVFMWVNFKIDKF